MIEAETAIEIGASPSAIVSWMRDLERYRTIDPKMRRVLSVRWSGDRAQLRATGRLRHLPAVPVAFLIRIRGNDAIEVESDPAAWQTRIVKFRGTYHFDETTPGRTRVLHRQEFTFRTPLGWLLDPYLERWHRRTTREQLVALRNAIETQASKGSAATLVDGGCG